jgi:hypothetical protein
MNGAQVIMQPIRTPQWILDLSKSIDALDMSAKKLKEWDLKCYGKQLNRETAPRTEQTKQDKTTKQRKDTDYE